MFSFEPSKTRIPTEVFSHSSKPRTHLISKVKMTYNKKVTVRGF